ncbi:hypothetical protein ACFWY9_37710 [Amycolatopsis sp. NPDC059027]|uniref:hypothetical protein n=1 Tax=Amycolatopsis sp. NPDC059027 TaxID=3346709 RepID=UPI00366F50A7
MTWENLQARLFHLGWLGEELPAFVADNDAPTGAWLFRQIIREAHAVASIAAAYVAECERAGLSGPNGTTPAPPSWRTADESRPGDTPAESTSAAPAGATAEPAPADTAEDVRPRDVTGRIPAPRPGADVAGEHLRPGREGGDALDR